MTISVRSVVAPFGAAKNTIITQTYNYTGEGRGEERGDVPSVDAAWPTLMARYQWRVVQLAHLKKKNAWYEKVDHVRSQSSGRRI